MTEPSQMTLWHTLNYERPLEGWTHSYETCAVNYNLSVLQFIKNSSFLEFSIHTRRAPEDNK